jgi:hypothetical protein
MMTMRTPVIPKVAPMILPILCDFRFVEVSALDDIGVGSWFGKDEAVVVLVGSWFGKDEAVVVLVILEVSVIVSVLAGADGSSKG